ncbi:MAG: hypothetical protein ASARMPRED_003967 [Alectoria sarmentosa]|nr:MAG: hypothetical protein ASARMPRED_003967 [Alectoria sarmentosa]
MISQGSRFVLRLPKLTLQCLGNRTGLSSSRVERVPALYDIFQSQHLSDLLLKSSLITPILRRTYAQRAVSRPKAHTGRTTTAARKAPTTSKTKAAKKPAPKKTTPKAVPKAKSKAKPRITPKPKPAKKKKAAKAKAKPKPKLRKPKVLTEVQKSALTKRQLKATALKPPHGVASSTWGVFLAEKMRADSAARVNFGSLSKEASAEYKQLTPEKVEHYNHLANQNKAANATAYRQWIESHTPTIIHKANLARQHLRRLGGSVPQLQDHRQVKGLRGPFTWFHQERRQSGDLRGLKVGEAAKLTAREWKALSASEKKPYQDLAAQDMARYTQERKTVLNKDVQHKQPKT